jgi:hypothetical protein
LEPVRNLGYRTDDDGSAMVDHDTRGIVMQWSPTPNATSYNIYGRTSDNPVYVLVAGMVTDTLKHIDTRGLFESGRAAEFMVLARNSTSASDAGRAEVVRIRDSTPPSLTVVDVQHIHGFDNGSAGQPKALRFLIKTFSEPLDTIVSPRFLVKEGGDDNDGDRSYTIRKWSWRWHSLSSGEVRFIVDPYSNGAGDSVFVDFSDLRDLAGNAMDSAGAVLRCRTYR